MASVVRLSDGEKGITPYRDVCRDLELAAQNAYDTLHGGSATILVSLDTAGRVTFTTTGAAAEQLVINVGASDFDTAKIGIQSDLMVMDGNGVVTTTHQAFGQWHPKWESDHVAPDVEYDGYTESETRLGRPVGVNHTGEAYALLRRLDWTIPGIPAALVHRSRTNNADACADAVIAIGEVNTWDRFRQYLRRDKTLGGVGDKRIYLYSSNDPSASPVREGPFLVKFYEVGAGSEATSGAKFIDPSSHVRDLASEHYPIRLLLWSLPS